MKRLKNKFFIAGLFVATVVIVGFCLGCIIMRGQSLFMCRIGLAAI